jgi:NADH:ubiquinone oxidoreductase subunit E
MAWMLKEALDYYRRQGAPADQSALISLLTEIQQEHGGTIPKSLVSEIATEYAVKDALILAIIRRIPRLRLSDIHTLEVCAGPNCGKAAAMAAAAEKLAASHPGKILLKFTPCMRLCAKGPNIRWDGQLHHKADETLLQRLTDNL